MAKVTVAHHPELTEADAFGVFERHFARRYEMFPTGVNGGFAVLRNDVTVVKVRLKQKRNSTTFVLTGLTTYALLEEIPVASIRFPLVFLSNLILHLFLWPWRNALLKEVRAFIETAPEFN